jgi:hypothetical protein
MTNRTSEIVKNDLVWFCIVIGGED